jgi:predicted nuclease of restriction endonuclease-like (RecB) superfamily
MKPTFVHSNSVAKDNAYQQWFGELKSRLRSHQVKAAMHVNTEMLEFYWSLGRDLVQKKAETQWGAGVVEQLSLDLKDAFPGVKGFSTTNIWYSKKWYLYYNEHVIKLHQPGGEIPMPKEFGAVPWRHHVEIITKCQSVEEALFYVNKVLEEGWSRRRLEDELANNLYVRQGKAITNFSTSLMLPQSTLATEVLKDPYTFDFLTLTQGYNEKQLEDALAHNITRFLLELGSGFAYVGRQMELRMPNGQSYFPDMVFYHIKMRCYVVVELKVVEFMPEFAGKLNFYVSAADHLLRSADDNPTIGLLICRSKDETIVQWSLEEINRPIGVASYQLQEVVDETLRMNLEN